MKYIVFGLFLLCTLVTPVCAEEELLTINDPVLGEKMELCEIAFQPDSYKLSQQAMVLLDSVVDQLESVDTSIKVIRIEGFTGGQDTLTSTTELSMLRALAVEEYFRVQHNVSFERFLTGHNATTRDCNVKIFIYDNPWNIGDAPIQLTDRGNLDGPS